MGTQVRPIDFGLTGNEFQDVFNVDKYIALAYQQPKGVLLLEKVEEDWPNWCEIVADAPWLKYWKRSGLRNEPCITPLQQSCSVGGCGAVPLVIFSTAVWGLGIDGWLRTADTPFRPLSRTDTRPVNPAVTEMLRLQGIKCLNIERKYLWDAKLYRGCGIQLPPELGELDRWLQPRWDHICNSSK